MSMVTQDVEPLFSMQRPTNFCSDGECSGCGNCCSNCLPVTADEIKIIKAYISRHNIKPENHCSLTEDSIVESRVYIGVKEKTPEGKIIYKPIFGRDMSGTRDSLTKRELKKIKKEAGGAIGKNRKTLKTTLKKWRKHFRK